MMLRKNGAVMALIALFTAAMLTSCSTQKVAPASSEVKGEPKTTVQTTTNKKQKNGFNENKNAKVTVGNYALFIPKYWNADITEADHYRAYAETSEKVAMLQITSHYDEDDPVTFEELEQENDSGAMASAIATWFDSCGEIRSELYDNGAVKGYIYTCDFVQNGYSGKAETFTFPSSLDSCWIYVTLVETDNTKYSYFDDFSKIIDSILDGQTARAKAIKKYPKEATYTYRERRDTVHLTINFERQWISSYTSTMNTRTSSHIDNYEGEYPEDLIITKTFDDGETVEHVIKFIGPDEDPSESIEETSTYSSGHVFVDKYKRQSVEWQP